MEHPLSTGNEQKRVEKHMNKIKKERKKKQDKKLQNYNCDLVETNNFIENEVNHPKHGILRERMSVARGRFNSDCGRKYGNLS